MDLRAMVDQCIRDTKTFVNADAADTLKDAVNSIVDDIELLDYIGNAMSTERGVENGRIIMESGGISLEECLYTHGVGHDRHSEAEDRLTNFKPQAI